MTLKKCVTGLAYYTAGQRRSDTWENAVAGKQRRAIATIPRCSKALACG